MQQQHSFIWDFGVSDNVMLGQRLNTGYDLRIQ